MTAEKQSADAEAQEQAPPPEAESADEPEAVFEGENASDTVTQLSELTADLQRVTAEYHNYRKRVERDKAMAADQATANVVAGLLPILDDIDRAREHGDLEGPFATVAEQLNNALVKLGLEVFGSKGDPFDPAFHEAVAHMHSPEVTEASCVDVMRRGYRIGERLLRPAMVAVAEPAEPLVTADHDTEADEAELDDPSSATAQADVDTSESTGDSDESETVDGDPSDSPDTESGDSGTSSKPGKKPTGKADKK